MQYLIDGHNLIPKLGLQLESFDDELDLVARLQEYCRLRRSRAEVYFDGALPGQTGSRIAGAVTAHFVRKGSSADAAIEIRLERLGRAAKNWTVISSDHRIQRAAQAVHAGALSSEEFARLMSVAQAESTVQSKSETHLSPDEVEEWISIFKRRG
jgi:predicted RNA-binding protein with PIN domain